MYSKVLVIINIRVKIFCGLEEEGKASFSLSKERAVLYLLFIDQKKFTHTPTPTPTPKQEI